MLIHIDTTGKNIYSIVLNQSNQFYNKNTQLFEAFNASNWTAYSITLTEQSTSGIYLGTIPSVIKDFVRIIFYNNATPAVTDTPIGRDSFYYNGNSIGSNIVSIDNERTNSNSAVLNLKQLNIVNNSGDAIYAQSTGSNGRGFHVVGHGTSSGFRIVGGTTGPALMIVGGSTSGNGVTISTTNGHGIISTGSGSNNGFRIEAGATASALRIVGGSTNGQGINITTTNGDGIIVSAGGDNHALNLLGSGTGSGLRVIGGSTGVGWIVSASGSSTVSFTNTSANTTFVVSNTGTGPAASFNSAAGNGIGITSGGIANALSISAAAGSGSGIGVRGGTLGGNAINLLTFDGHGINFDISGSGKYDINAQTVPEELLSLFSEATNEYFAIFDSVASTSTTTSVIGSASLSSTNNFYRYAVIVFKTGSLKGIARRISSYNGTTKTISVDNPFPATPSISDGFAIIGLIL